MSPSPRNYTSDGGSKVTLGGSASVKATFLNVLGYSQIPISVDIGRHLGQYPAARRAGARQYRIDERRRQDRRAEDRIT